MALLTFTVCSVGYLAEHGPRETLRFWAHSCFQHVLNISSASGELLTIRLVTPSGWDLASSGALTAAHHAREQRVARRALARKPGPSAMLAAYPALASQLSR